MHRTEGNNNTQVGGENRFTDGPPGTTVGAAILNAIQEEICDVIEGVGLTLYNESNDIYGQLYSAILLAAPMPRGYIDGLVLANGTDANHDIDIYVGKCRDSADSLSINLSAAITKQIDANWAVGTNQGGFPSGLGAVAADTWYHVFVISKTDGLTVDAGFDTNLNAVNLLGDATDYTKFRRIGSVLTDGTSNIIAFHQYGDTFIWDVMKDDVRTANPGVAAVTESLSVPNGLEVNAINVVSIEDATSTTNVRMLVTNLDQADTAPGDAAFTVSSPDSSGDDSRDTAEVITRTNTSRQVRYRLTVTDVDITAIILTKGWVDDRGQNA